MKPIRVAIHAHALHSPRMRGWTRYTINLIEYLPRHDVEVFVYAFRPIDPVHEARLRPVVRAIRVGSARRYLLWEQVEIPRQCQRDRIDVFHSPLNFGLPVMSPVPRVLTLHDAIDPLYYLPRQPWSQRWSRASVQSQIYHWVARQVADRVITVSEHARGDLVQRLRIPPKRVNVIAEAADPAFVAYAGPPHQAERPYVFYVGGWEERKNLPLLLRAFAQAAIPGIDLVLGGGSEVHRTALRHLGDQLGLGDRLRLVGFIPDEELPAWYAGAMAFVYPSVYEGFGLQLVEAMAMGTPTLAARSSCLPEVLGNGGVTFGLDDPRELAEWLQRLATSPADRDNLRERARQRGRDFSWDRAAAATAALYRQVCS